MFKQLMLFVMWMSIVASIVAVFARVWQPVELEAYKAGTELAARRMLEVANQYKQEWLLQGQPAQIVVEGQAVPLTRYGWVPLVDEQEQFACQRWLALHYPDGKILDSSLQAVREQSINQAYQCEFDYGFKQIIVVYQKDKIQKISADILSE